MSVRQTQQHYKVGLAFKHRSDDIKSIWPGMLTLSFDTKGMEKTYL